MTWCAPPSTAEQALEQAWFLIVGEAHRLVFAEEARHHVLIGLGHVAAGEVNGRRALVGGLQHRFALRNHADELDAQNVLDVGQREHLAVADALGVVAGDEQMLADRLAAFDGALGFARQHAQNAVGVAHRRDFRVGDDEGLVGEVHGHERPALNPGRRVADDVGEAHVVELLEHVFHALHGERVFVAGLRGGEDEQVVALLVLDQRLGELGLALNDVDEVVHHAALAAHDEVEVAQADVEVDDGGFVAAQGQAGGEAGAGGGLAHAAFARSHHNDFRHEFCPSKLFECQRFDQQLFALQPHGGRLAAHSGGKVLFGGAVDAGNGDQLRLEAGAENPRRGVAARPGQRPAAQRAVDMHMPFGHDFRAVADHALHDEVAGGIDALTRAQRAVDEHRGQRCGGGFRGGCCGRDGRLRRGLGLGAGRRIGGCRCGCSGGFGGFGALGRFARVSGDVAAVEQGQIAGPGPGLLRGLRHHAEGAHFEAAKQGGELVQRQGGVFGQAAQIDGYCLAREKLGCGVEALLQRFGQRGEVGRFHHQMHGVDGTAAKFKQGGLGTGHGQTGRLRV